MISPCRRFTPNPVFLQALTETLLADSSSSTGNDSPHLSAHKRLTLRRAVEENLKRSVIKERSDAAGMGFGDIIGSSSTINTTPASCANSSSANSKVAGSETINDSDSSTGSDGSNGSSSSNGAISSKSTASSSTSVAISKSSISKPISSSSNISTFDGLSVPVEPQSRARKKWGLSIPVEAPVVLGGGQRGRAGVALLSRANAEELSDLAVGFAWMGYR